MVSSMGRWPEWLFVALVMVLPLAMAIVQSSETFVGFLAWLGLGMLAGTALWVAVIWLACWDYKRRGSGDV
jgi:hypothetical protein